VVHQEADYATAWAGEVLKGGFVPGMYCNFVCAEDVRNALKKGYPPQEAWNDPELQKLQALPQFLQLVNQFAKKNH